MKLRIQGDSLRLRLLQSEVQRLVETGCVEERTRFAAGRELLYAVRTDAGAGEMGATFGGASIVVTVPEHEARAWAASEQVGLYSRPARGGVTVSVEKDFACLDRTDADNTDTYPNPKAKC